jgi:hypothetical protein
MILEFMYVCFAINLTNFCDNISVSDLAGYSADQVWPDTLLRIHIQIFNEFRIRIYSFSRTNLC